MARYLAIVIVALVQNALLCGASTPVPISVNFGSEFFGLDGLWSAAQIRVGTPEQYLWVYPNTVNSDTWVVGPSACDGSFTCTSARGGVFYSNESSSYYPVGRFDLVGSNPLNMTANYGDYGLDTISVSDSSSAPNQAIATVTDPDVWIGRLGLNVEETRLTNNTNYFSIISALVQNDSAIPSHSYGYTAGAHYKLKSVPGSLVLGGVDVTRFTANNATFSLGPAYVPKLAVQGITVTSSQSQGLVAMPPNWNSNPLTLMQQSEAALFTIDSSTPYLWMPPSVCDTFAQALNLTYDESLELYVFPNTSNSTSSPQLLNDWGLSFTFTLANSTDSTASHQVTISYNAFNLQLLPGYPGLNIASGSSSVDYFPLRRASSEDQYTIGRAFLQETYLTVDYERSIFSLAPAAFVDPSIVIPDLVPITRPARSTWPGPSSDHKSGLSPGAKAGLAIGIIVGVIALVATVLLVTRRRRSVAPNNEKAIGNRQWKFLRLSKKLSTPATPISELTGDRTYPRELLVDSSNTRFELPSATPVEMPAAEVPEAFLAANQAVDDITQAPGVPTLRVDTDRQSISKDYNIRSAAAERPESPAPPYPSSDIRRDTTSSSGGISSLESPLGRGLSSHTSSGAEVSPIVPRGAQLLPDTTGTTNLAQALTTPLPPSSTARSRTSNGIPNVILIAPLDGASRALSQDGQRQDDSADDQSPISDTQDEPPQIRPRFSWEQ